jgi:rare lipoprotein A
LLEEGLLSARILFLGIRFMYTVFTRNFRLLWLCCSISIAAIISSCATYQRSNTSAEQQYQSTRQITPQKPYIVNGKRYEPLSSHEGFEQDGIASSYGQEFHGRRTSSGETFDMNAMTAAHKTLPLGVYVRVQLKRNGNEIVVRINDRGPFVRDRIIDLSDAAADRLGMLREGVAPVRITALGYRIGGVGNSFNYRPPASYDSGMYSLQVGAFTIKANAYRFADELKRKYDTADVQEALVGGTKYYRVRVGHYTSLRVAQGAQEQYERKGFNNCFVVAVD